MCHELGPVEALQVEDVDVPTLRPGQVMVAVEAAGVTFVGALLVAGRYPLPIPVPCVPGGEVAGSTGGAALEALLGRRVTGKRALVPGAAS